MTTVTSRQSSAQNSTGNTMTTTDELVSQLSLLEKAALLSGENNWQSRAVPRLGIEQIWMADGPHGLRKQLGSADHLGLNGSEPATAFPTAATIASSWDVELAEELGAALGREAAAQDVHVLLGPGLNIKRSPLGGRNFEYFSEDPELSGRMAAAYVRGVQSQGVAATPKHYAVNSQELRRMVSDSVIDERTLRELYLTAFEIVVKEAAPWALMSSYNRVNGVYAHEHSFLMQTILREEWGFDGAVISDWGGVSDPVAAIPAGGTLAMPSPGYDFARRIVQAVQNGELTQRDLDQRVGEVIDLVARVTHEDASQTVDPQAHHELARRAAAHSMVLLRNEDSLLPLAAGTSVALIGDFAETPRFQGAGSSTVNPTRNSSVLEEMKGSTLRLSCFAPGFRRDGQVAPELLADAVTAAASAEVAVLMLGQPESAESEGLDRGDLKLPAVQIELLRAVAEVNPRTVVVLSAGGVLEMPWIGHAGAVIHAHLAGQAGPEALLDVITGAVNPSGRIAESYPLQLSDTPTARTFPSSQRTAEYREGLFSGYRYYERAGIEVAFPFGFGLSFTSFAYSDLEATDESVRFTITNTGERTGTETAQLYIGRLGDSALPRPVHELKDFARVHLAPGESTEVHLDLNDRAFRAFDVTSGTWKIEAGEYELAVGPNLQDLPLRATVTLAATELGALATDTRSTLGAHLEGAAAERYAAADVQEVPDRDFAALLGHAIPDPAWPQGPLGLHDPMDRLAEARSLPGRLAHRVLAARLDRAGRAGAPDLDALFLLNGPFRIISTMSNGLATSRIPDALLTLVNGQPLRGVAGVVGGFVRGRIEERRTRQAFRAAASVGPNADHDDPAGLSVGPRMDRPTPRPSGPPPSAAGAAGASLSTDTDDHARSSL